MSMSSSTRSVDSGSSGGGTTTVTVTSSAGTCGSATSLPLAASGFLKKLSLSRIKGDHERFFELRGSIIRYYKTAPREDEKPLGSIDLQDTTTTEDPRKPLQWSICGPTLPKTYTLVAGNERDKAHWCAMIKAAVQNANVLKKESMQASTDERFDLLSVPTEAPTVQPALKRVGTMSPTRMTSRMASVASLPRVLTQRRTKKAPKEAKEAKKIENKAYQRPGSSAALRSQSSMLATAKSQPNLSKMRSPTAAMTRSPSNLQRAALQRSPSNLQKSSLQRSQSTVGITRAASTTKEMFKKQEVCLDSFDLLCVVGKGSFGKVMQVRKKDTKEIFAMKCMSKELILREGLVDHMKAEKSILSAINHPLIVKMYYAFQTADSLFLILDFLSGGELFYHLSQVGTFPESRAKFYTAQIGLALGHLHSLNIIYRDLKPENCVLDKKGNCCITDFGLAKPGVGGREETSTFCGTPEYLAPEFLEKGCHHGRAVDWWSLGILLYEMIAGMWLFFSFSGKLLE